MIGRERAGLHLCTCGQRLRSTRTRPGAINIRDLQERAAVPMEVVLLRDVAPTFGSSVTQTVVDIVLSDATVEAGLALLKEELLGMLVSVEPTFDLKSVTCIQRQRDLYLLRARLDMLANLPLLAQVLTVVERLGKEPAPTPADLAEKLSRSTSSPYPSSHSRTVATRVPMSHRIASSSTRCYLLYMLRRWAPSTSTP